MNTYHVEDPRIETMKLIKSFFGHVGMILLLIACVVLAGYSFWYGIIAVNALDGVYQFPIYTSAIITISYLWVFFGPQDQGHIF